MKINRKNNNNAISAFGRVDTGNEICLNAVATGFDAINNNIIGVGVSERFKVLKLLCQDIAPNKVSIIDDIINIIDGFFNGSISKNKAMNRLNNIHKKIISGFDVFNIAMFKQAKHQTNPFQIDVNLFMGDKNMKKNIFSRRF